MMIFQVLVYFITNSNNLLTQIFAALDAFSRTLSCGKGGGRIFGKIVKNPWRGGRICILAVGSYLEGYFF